MKTDKLPLIENSTETTDVSLIISIDLHNFLIKKILAFRDEIILYAQGVREQGQLPFENGEKSDDGNDTSLFEGSNNEEFI